MIFLFVVLLVEVKNRLTLLGSCSKNKLDCFRNNCGVRMSKNILIIDDSAAQRKVVRLALESKGYQIIEAENGQEGLNKLTSDLNLIVCDVNMPVMDGIEFVTQIKQNPDYKFLPIIMLTTESQEAMREKGMELGVRAWLNKPFSMEQLLDATNRLML